MSDVFSYTPISVTGIADALSVTMAAQEGEGEHFVRAATVNTLMVVDGRYDAQDVEDLLLTLSQVHPNRTFVLVIDESVGALKVEYSARCHAISPKEHVCSEVVRLVAPPSQIDSIASAVRANLMTGMPSELCIFYATSHFEFVKSISTIADQILFSSALFEDDLSRLNFILDSNQLLVDLEWVKLGIWRDQIREVFDKPAWLTHLSDLKRIEIIGRASSSEALPVGGFLLAGWLAAQLGLILKGGGGSNFELLSPSGNRINLVMSSAPGTHDGVHEVNLQFACASGNSDNGTVNIKRSGNSGAGGRLDTTVDFGEEFHVSKQCDVDSRDDLIKRYFFIGESTLNYRKALGVALEFARNKP